jgi:hypothetical protein
MAERDDFDESGPYRLAKDAPPVRRRYRPMPGDKASSERNDDDPYDQPVLKRFMGADPFPWALAMCVLTWVILGLIARHDYWIGLVMVGVGFGVCIGSQIWLYVSIFMDDREAGILSLISGWYRVFYLYMNPELAWRPTLLTLVGALMAFTGIALFVNNAK